MLPFMIAVQEACARIGLVTGKGIAAVVKQHYSRFVLYSVVILVLLANTINIGADIGAMAASAKLLVNLPFAVLILFFAAGILILEIFTSYRMYARILKWLALVLLAYPITALMVHEPWLEILKATLVPHLDFNFGFLFIIIGSFRDNDIPIYVFLAGLSGGGRIQVERILPEKPGQGQLYRY